jgi:hypothetical protein
MSKKISTYLYVWSVMPCTVGDGAFSIVYAKTLSGSTTDLRITPNVGVIITRVIMAGN